MGGYRSNSKTSLINLEVCCLPKGDGGLGVRNQINLMIFGARSFIVSLVEIKIFELLLLLSLMTPPYGKP